MNKKEWFSINYKDMIYIVKFFIKLFDKNNGSEDPKMIVDFIKNISKRELEQEYISDIIYDKFFEENIEIDLDGNKSYKCTMYSIQKELSLFLKKSNINKPIKVYDESNKYMEIYTSDIKRYIKNKFNKLSEKINIDDVKNKIHDNSRVGYIGFRMKNLYTDQYFNDEIYIEFINKYLIVNNIDNSRIAVSELLVNFDNYLIKDKIQSVCNSIKTKKNYFSAPFREEFIKKIEKYTKLKVNKKMNISRKIGYAGFAGLKFKI